MKTFISLLIFLSIGTSSEPIVELPIGLTEDEMLRIHEIYSMGRETDPPPSPVRNVAEYERMQGVLIRYPFGISTEIISEMSFLGRRAILTEEYKRNERFNNIDLTYFKDSFIQPTDGIISGVFGSQRILNGKAKSPHRGLDIAAETGTPIYACNEGLVIHAEDDLYYTGGTIILDHGHGVKSIYAHLSDVKVNVNQTVSKDDIIGEVGSTGRSTGPHLHWGVMVFNTYVDPQLLLD